MGGKVEETKGKDQVKQDHMKELQFKWDGKAIIWFLCNRLERTKAEASRPVRRILQQSRRRIMAVKIRVVVVHG